MSQTLCLHIETLHFTKKKRRGISPKRVEELRRLIETGEEVRPIKVHALGDGTYILKDGRHRIQAHIAAGIMLIWAVVENIMRRLCNFFRLFQ